MSYFLVLGIITASAFLFGAIVGYRSSNSIMDRADWQVLKWDDTIFGWRPVKNLDLHIKRGDKIMLGIRINTSWIPDDGIKVLNGGKND